MKHGPLHLLKEMKVCVCVVEGGEGCSHLLLEVIKLLDSDSVKNTD